MRRARYLSLTAQAITANLHRSIAIGRELLHSPAGNIVMSGIRILNSAAFLACDTETLRLAVAAAKRAQHSAPGVIEPLLKTAEHRLRLLQGEPRATPFQPTDYPLIGLTAPELLIECRDAIDAGCGDAALRRARQSVTGTPRGQALLALVEAIVHRDRDRFIDLLNIAIDNELSIYAVNALEGLAVAEARNSRWVNALRLLTVAEHLRRDTGYRWRFDSEQQEVNAARTATKQALGRQAKAVMAEADRIDWHDVANHLRSPTR